MTLRAVATLAKIDCVVAPESEKSKGSRALEIASSHLPGQIEKVYLHFPMSYDTGHLASMWEENVSKILTIIEEGKNVGFLTLGDPGVYSTYSYLVPLLLEKGVHVETVAGIPSFCAIGARTNTPLAAWGESLAVIPMRKGAGARVDDALDRHENVIVMKPSADPLSLRDIIEKRGLDSDFILVSRCGTCEERISREVSDLDSTLPYLSTLIIKKGGM